MCSVGGESYLASGVADSIMWALRELAPLPGSAPGGESERKKCSASLLTLLSLYLIRRSKGRDD